MSGRVVTLLRDKNARGFWQGSWFFVGHENGTGVRVTISRRDWESVVRASSTIDKALDELERMAALASDKVPDAYGGYAIPVVLDECGSASNA